MAVKNILRVEDLELIAAAKNVVLREARAIEEHLFLIDDIEEKKVVLLEATFCFPVLIHIEVFLVVARELFEVKVRRIVDAGKRGLHGLLHERHAHALPLREAVRDDGVPVSCYFSGHCECRRSRSFRSASNVASTVVMVGTFT